MILIKSNGLELICRKVGPVIMRVVPREKRVPIPIIVNEILDDDLARERIRALLAIGCYVKTDL